jgi:hypothetical protein
MMSLGSVAVNQFIRVTNFSRFGLVVFAAVLCGCASLNHANCVPMTTPRELLQQRTGVFLGDIHGTTEAPQFVARLACEALKARPIVYVALEYPRDEQGKLDAFMANPSSEDAKRVLLNSQFWKTVPDGRASVAMLNLLSTLRELSRSTGRIKVFAYDVPKSFLPRLSAVSNRPAVEGANLRELDDANYLETLRLAHGQQNAFWILFGGGIHVRKIKGELPSLPPESGYDRFEPLGYLLQSWQLLHLNIAHDGGTVQACRAERPDTPASCGTHTVQPYNEIAATPFSIVLSSSDGAFDGYYVLGTVSASPSARDVVMLPSNMPNATPNR